MDRQKHLKGKDVHFLDMLFNKNLFLMRFNSY